MKALSVILMWLGTAILVVFALRMFGFFEQYITTDKAWLSLLFIGLLTACLGFRLEENFITPTNDHAVYQQKVRKSALRNCLCLCAVVLLFIVGSLI